MTELAAWDLLNRQLTRPYKQIQQLESIIQMYNTEPVVMHIDTVEQTHKRDVLVSSMPLGKETLTSFDKFTFVMFLSSS